ncbi:hypothetical protein [Streptococcus huangxiaojuni]|uniref:hypothetical protein n=1 Tax=Streptococcus huangxiaojuni TaxID=3237239 RepID=UPI003F5E329C
MVVLLIFGIFIAIVAVTLSLVFILIRHVNKANRRYETFAKQYGYQFDKAQGRAAYRDYSRNNTKKVVNMKLVANPYVEKYANYTSYPFGRGAHLKVAYVISGTYQHVPFRAFTYQFTGSSIEQSGPGGVFSIVMIQTETAHFTDLPDNVFYENKTLCEYLPENLNVDTIHKRIENLIKIKEIEDDTETVSK